MDNGNNVDHIVFNLDDQVVPIYQESTTMDSGVENWVFLALESKRGRAWFFLSEDLVRKKVIKVFL